MKVANIDIKSTLVGVVGTLAGVAAGSILKKSLTTSPTVEGLAGNGKNYIVPTIILLGGAVVSGMSQDKLINSAALGFSAVGGASIANELAGKQIVSLGRVGSVGTMKRIPRTRPVRIPQQGVSGQGATLYPGMSGQDVLLPGMSGQDIENLSLIQ